MIADDSSNETDGSFYDLYSTKNVINAYQAALKEFQLASSEDEVVISERVDRTGKKRKNKTETAKLPLKKFSRQASPEIIELNDSPRSVLIAEESPNLRSTRLSNRRNRKNLRTSYSTRTQTRKRHSGNKRRKKNSDVIVIEGDDNKRCSNVNPSLDDDEVNYEVSVKVLWKSVSVETFRLRRFQTFTRIFEHFMKKENVPMEKLMFTLENKKILPNDTPDSVNLKVYEFIEGGVLSSSFNNTSKETLQSKPSNEKDCIILKIQDVNKKILKFSVNKKESFKSIMIRYAEQTEISVDKFKFYFDGEILNSSETPASLDLDNDEIIDVKLIE